MCLIILFVLARSGKGDAVLCAPVQYSMINELFRLPDYSELT